MNHYKLSPEFAAAYVKAQGEIEGAIKGSMNPAFRSKYADLGAVWEACREALQNNGLAVAQFPCNAPPGHVGLETILVFKQTGEALGKEATIPFKDPTNPQAAGSAYTYLRRYALSAVMGICPEDDDGNKAVKESKKAEPVDAKTTQVAYANFSDFNKIKNLDDMKTEYTRVRLSDLPEPSKTKLLTDMANVITQRKADMAANSTKGTK